MSCVAASSGRRMGVTVVVPKWSRRWPECRGLQLIGVQSGEVCLVRSVEAGTAHNPPPVQKTGDDWGGQISIGQAPTSHSTCGR